MQSRLTPALAGLLCFAGLVSLDSAQAHAQGFKLDIGQFAPQARGVVIEFGRDRLRVDVPQRGLHLNFGGNGLPQSTGEFPFLPFPQAEGDATEPGGSADPLEPSIELGDPQVDLGEPQTSAPADDDPDSSFAQRLPGPSADSDVELGDAVSEPPARIIPDPPEPGQPLPPAEVDVPPAPAGPGYMGLLATPVPPAIQAHFANLIPQGEGLLVTSVVPDSPASAAGIEPNDILLRYDDTPLASFQQLTELVRRDEAGAEVQLHGVRAGRAVDLTITLGEAPLLEQPQPETVPPQAMDFRQFLTPGGAPANLPGNIDISAIGPQLLEKAHRLLTNYRLVGVDYQTLPGGRFEGVVTLADASGGIHELPASGTETEVQLQLIGQLLRLP